MTPALLSHHGRLAADGPANAIEEIGSTESADSAAARRTAVAPGGPAAAQSGAAGHQPRRRRAVRRTGRARRSSAPRGRAEIEIPLAHEPRIPHAAQLDPGAVAAAAGAQRWRADGGAGDADPLHPQGCGEPDSSWSTICWTSPRSRRARRWWWPRRSPSPRCSARCAACCGRCWSATRSPWCSRSRTMYRHWTPTKARCRRFCATSSPTRSSSPSTGEVRVWATADPRRRHGQPARARHRRSASPPVTSRSSSRNSARSRIGCKAA